ncbi:hypothetical protein Ddye_023264 [Dipteronia dyeriana]|uniref:Fe2OG dioxygenase domain-containing protein n=1 Tax=Dipteronia dyeriana TaxID=168575 RepID=A0AAD9TSS3_9ROSI|nr:hypothetical protein Ddye_023264 [Dipteronia dyeriana]
MAQAISISLDDSSDMTDFLINQGHGVKGLSEMGIKTLPKQYIQPMEERLMTKIEPQESIPVIDMSKWDDIQVANSICDAAEKWGFFQVVNHGVPLQVLDDVKKATHGFFGLPAEEKRKYSKENSSSNNVRFGTSFTPQVEKALEWKDYLSLFHVSDEEPAALWPPVRKNIDSKFSLTYREQIFEYMKSSKPLIKHLLQVLMKRLNVNEIDETKQSLLTGSNLQLELAVTQMFQDNVGGLYVRGNEGEDSWIHVPPINGATVINIGDALQIMSNGRYRSVEHRVTANGSSNRISVPIFVNPRPQDMIGPLPETLNLSTSKFCTLIT